MPAVRRFVWVTLQAAGMLSLSACFTIIDFDLGEGGSGTGGTSPTTTGGGGTGGGEAGGNAPSGGGPPVCATCPDTCDQGVCQAEVLHTAGAEIKVLGAGGDRVVYLDDAPGNKVQFVNAKTGALVKTMFPATGEPWDLAGSLTVSPDGVAFYAPQDPANANPTTPLQECDPVGTDCALSFTAPDNTGHFNGLAFFDGYVFGMSTADARVWSAKPTDTIGGVAFALVNQAGTAVLAPHDLVLRGSRVLASSLGLPAAGPPCLAIGDVDPLIEQNTGDSLTCHALPAVYRQISSPAISGDGSMFARVVVGDEAPYNGLTVKFDDEGNPSNNFPHHAFPIPDLSTSVGGIATDKSGVYFFGELNGKRLLRCGINGLSNSCKPASLPLVGLGLLAENAEAVFFSVGPVLYRVEKTDP